MKTLKNLALSGTVLFAALLSSTNASAPFGDIYFKGAGIFIAGGAGITPFIAIFKNLEKENKIEGNKLIFVNKQKADIILEDHYNALLEKKFINVLSKEEIEGYKHGYISLRN